MTLTAVLVATVPDVIAIARRLAGGGGLAVLHRQGALAGWPMSYVATEPRESVSSLLPPPSAAATSVGDTRAGAPRWIGAIPYECGRGLERPGWSLPEDARPAPHVMDPIWHRYGAVVEVDARSGLVRVIGDDPARVRALCRELRHLPVGPRAGAASVRALATDDPPAAHAARVVAAKALIASGDLYQVNLARRLRFAVTGDPIDVYAAMARQTAAPFGVFLDGGDVQICASSPELFLSLDAKRWVTTSPIKGTRPRGFDAREDRTNAKLLAESAKEVAELTMILDVERSDLGRVAEAGSVRLLGPPMVETHPTLHHRAGTVVARLKRGASATDLVRAMFPSGSVTGAPKVRAMEVIARLEPVRRGLYTGALGAVAFDGSLRLAMAIRVLTLRAGEGHYHTGGGIVADSEPEDELEETRWKALQIESLLSPGGA